MSMTRREEREQREAAAIREVVHNVFADWGIWPDDHTPEAMGHTDMGDGFAAQIGQGEAVEYHEVYHLILDVAKTVHRMPSAGPSDAVSRTEYDEAVAEAKRLQSIIERAYGTDGWDIGSMKSVLIPGLPGYENYGRKSVSHAHAHTWGPPIGRPSLQLCECGAHQRTPLPALLLFTDEDVRLEFGEGSSEQGWWIELVLDDENSDDRVRLSLDDMEATKLSDRLAEKVREGRKDWQS